MASRSPAVPVFFFVFFFRLKKREEKSEFLFLDLVFFSL